MWTHTWRTDVGIRHLHTLDTCTQNHTHTELTHQTWQTFAHSLRKHKLNISGHRKCDRTLGAPMSESDKLTYWTQAQLTAASSTDDTSDDSWCCWTTSSFSEDDSEVSFSSVPISFCQVEDLWKQGEIWKQERQKGDMLRCWRWMVVEWLWTLKMNRYDNWNQCCHTCWPLRVRVSPNYWPLLRKGSIIGFNHQHFKTVIYKMSVI